MKIEDQIFRPVNVKSRLPESRGWFNMICDAYPSPCGRAFFDGEGFNLQSRSHDWSSLLANGNSIYWLELIKPQ